MRKFIIAFLLVFSIAFAEGCQTFADNANKAAEEQGSPLRGVVVVDSWVATPAEYMSFLEQIRTTYLPEDVETLSAPGDTMEAYRMSKSGALPWMIVRGEVTAMGAMFCVFEISVLETGTES
jgi:hypothetical protein